MKKITLKISAFLLLVMFGLQVDAQPLLWTENGTYKIGARGTNLFMTINGGNLEWQTELPGDDPTQVWAIVDHRSPAAGGLMEITSQAGGQDWTMCLASDTGYPNVTLTVEQRLPKVVAAGDWSGLDQFQRRKAKVDANGDPDSGGSNPSTGNNALFIQAPAGTNSRYGAVPTAAGDAVQFDSGGIDVIDYHFIAALSINTFADSSIFVSNPIDGEFSIKGIPADAQEVNIYSLLGAKVLTLSVDSQESMNVNVSALVSGMYIVEIKGNNGLFTQKIIK